MDHLGDQFLARTALPLGRDVVRLCETMPTVLKISSISFVEPMMSPTLKWREGSIMETVDLLFHLQTLDRLLDGHLQFVHVDRFVMLVEGPVFMALIVDSMS